MVSPETNSPGLMPSGDHRHAHRLEVTDLHVHYGPVCAIHNVSFDSSCGDLTALIGPNGAGKSTLIKCLAGLLPHSSGEILWRGQPLHNQHSEIAYLPQRSEIDWRFPLTVEGLVETGRFPHVGKLGRFRERDREAVAEALRLMDIQDLRDRQISALSGGQQQRAFIARALAQEPHVLLLDEPFNGLDRPTRRDLSRLLRSLKTRGRLVIVSHHDLGSTSELFDRVVLLNRGLVACGPPDDVLTPDHLTQAFGEEPA